ncbi:proton glutamate symport protein [Cronobacter sp. 153480017-3]|nr:Proton/glutamate symport protein @ Proton/aspartate symport protein [Cronobacter sakazakii 701]
MVLIKRVKKPHNITQRLSYPFQLASFSFEHAWEWRCNLGSKVVMKNSKISLAWQILLALVLGILLGSFLHYQTDSREWLVTNLLSPAGDIFIHLIKMIVVPIVISTLVVGIAGVGDAKQLGRIGAKTILYFEVITTVAIVIGITLANVFQPGSGIDMSQLAAVDISKYQHTTEEVQSHAHGLMGTILSLVPTNIFASMAKGEMLPIIFFSVLFGLGLSSLPAAHREPLVTVFRSVSETMFKVTHMVMRYAPVGVFALISVTVANFGFASLWPLAKLVILVYVAILFFALIVLGAVARMCGLRVWTLIRILKDELILAYSTASSESVLPRIIEKMEAYGAPASITSFVVPTGYSFNLDGSTLYQSIAAIFIAQLYGIELSLGQEIILVLTLMVTSKGIAGVPGVSFVVLLATLGSVGIPLEGLAFIAGVDRILDMARTALNVVGNALAVLVIAKWEHKFDRKKAQAYEREMLGRFDSTANN